MGIRYFGIVVAVASILLMFELPPAVSAATKSLGTIYECAHALKGEVFVKNEREITIKGFNYDGTGPAAWFHGQLKGAQGIYTEGNYITLPFKGSCDRLEVGRSYKDEDVSLILPKSIKEFASIGIFCYKFCHNFGHVVIPEDLSVPAAPADLQVPEECPKPPEKYDDINSCTIAVTAVKMGVFKPADCGGGSGAGSGGAEVPEGMEATTKATGGVAQLMPNAASFIAGAIHACIFLSLRT